MNKSLVKEQRCGCSCHCMKRLCLYKHKIKSCSHCSKPAKKIDKKKYGSCDNCWFEHHPSKCPKFKPDKKEKLKQEYPDRPYPGEYINVFKPAKKINKKQFIRNAHKLHKEPEEDCPLCEPAKKCEICDRPMKLGLGKHLLAYHSPQVSFGELAKKEKCNHSWIQDSPIKVCYHCGFKPLSSGKDKEWEEEFDNQFTIKSWDIRKFSQSKHNQPIVKNVKSFISDLLLSQKKELRERWDIKDE